MNAIKFIQQHGVEKAREVVEGAPTGTNHYCADNYWFWDGTTLRRTAGDGFFIHSIWGASEERVSKAVSLPDLKRLVDSVEIVNKLGGIVIAREKLTYGNSISAMRLSYETTITGRDGTKQNVITGVYLEDLKQAIADYESIYKCTYCNGFGEVGCQFEGTFTCPDCNGDRYVGGEHV